MKEQETEILRRDLDDIFKKWRKVMAALPKRGWVHCLRTALGMTSEDLARRMQMSQAAIVSMEQSEAKGVIQLSTLRRAAKAMDCTLVYALVPRQPLATMIENRRKRVARGELARIMPLSRLVQPEYHDVIAAYAQRVKRNRLWRDEGVDLEAIKKNASAQARPPAVSPDFSEKT